jgi:hypothetical protein
MAFWVRPLGKRASPPAACGSVPHPERFDLVWAYAWPIPPSPLVLAADQLRDLLGLVTFRKGAELVEFRYPRDAAGVMGVPTAVEALGGWAFVPAGEGRPQMTYNYRTFEPGIAEFVHAAQVVPRDCRFRWIGTLTREWDG